MNIGWVTNNVPSPERPDKSLPMHASGGTDRESPKPA